MKVLVVDDSLLIRKRIIALLNRHEEIVVLGESGDPAAALKMIVELKPDAVVLDIRMPGGSGFHLLEYVKKQNLVRTVIILSNFSDATSRSQAAALGADYFFDKSNEFEKVPETILSLR